MFIKVKMYWKVVLLGIQLACLIAQIITGNGWLMIGSVGIIIPMIIFKGVQKMTDKIARLIANIYCHCRENPNFFAAWVLVLFWLGMYLFARQEYKDLKEFEGYGK